jgi:hypothetical protein
MSGDTDPPMATSLGFARAFSEDETLSRQRLTQALHDTPIPKGELGDNLGLFADRVLLSKILFLDHIYRLILGVPGVVLELGTRWGQSLAVMSNLRAIYEPTHHLRRIVGFDTFSGFADVAAEDGNSAYAQIGNLGTADGYEDVLAGILSAHEQGQPLAHKRKHEIVKGDVRATLPAWLDANPQAIVALAYLDMDLYEPTKLALEQLKPRLTRGSVVVLDELNCPGFPGETVAIREVLGLGNVALQRVPYLTYPSFFVYQG